MLNNIFNIMLGVVKMVRIHIFILNYILKRRIQNDRKNNNNNTGVKCNSNNILISGGKFL